MYKFNFVINSHNFNNEMFLSPFDYDEIIFKYFQRK